METISYLGMGHTPPQSLFFQSLYNTGIPSPAFHHKSHPNCNTHRQDIDMSHRVSIQMRCDLKKTQ